MHFNLLSLSGIKTMAGEFDLAPVTVLSGPNESGKSALLEALRLAATGSAQIGGTGRAIAEMLSEGNAHALVMAGSDSAEWRCRVGGTISQKRSGRTDLQGNCPISVDDFEKLSSAQKFALVGSDKLTGVVGEIEQLKEEHKRLRAAADAPPPAMPDMYDGKPLQELEAELQELVLALAKHREASEGIAARTAARAREEQRLADVTKEKGIKELEVNGAQKALAVVEAEHALLADLVDRYSKAAANAPTLIEWARRKGWDSKGLVDNLCKELADACEWMAAGATRGASLKVAKELKICMEQLRRIECPTGIPIPQPVFERDEELWEMVGKQSPINAIAMLNVKLQDAKQLLKTMQEEYAALSRAEHNHQQSLANELAIYGSPLDAETLASVIEQKAAIELLVDKCKKWEGWDVEAGKHAVRVSQSTTAMGDVDDKLSRLNKERAAIIESVTGPIEEIANGTLARVGLPPLSVSVEATAKTAQLVVRTSQGIQVAALAKSRRLAYSIALLSAIQQLSKAPCPLLLAECAEMDGQLFEVFAGALSPEKGNIILEHWTPCRIGHVIDLRGQLVGAV